MKWSQQLTWSFCSPCEAFTLRDEERNKRAGRFVVSTKIPTGSDKDFRFKCFSFNGPLEQLRNGGLFMENDVFDTELGREVE